MAEHFTEQQTREYREAFRVCDKDGDGNISVDELSNVFRNLGVHVGGAELQRMIKEVDEDGDGTINFNEFLMLMAEKMMDANFEQELMDAFRVFDKDQNGYISREELQEVLAKLGQRLSAEGIDEMIRNADKDGDGQINYDEFVKIMLAKRRAHGDHEERREHIQDEGFRCCMIL